MKKWIGIGAFCTIAVGTIIFGQLHWNEKIERTGTEASEYVIGQNNGNRAVGSSAERFNSGSNEEADSASAETSDENGSDQAGSSASNGSSSQSSNGTSSSTNGNSGNGSNTETEESNTSTSGSNTSSGSANTTSNLSAQDIMDTYLRQFQSLQSQETERVNQLILEARADYELIQAGQGDMSRTEMQVTYVEKVESLERNADARFNDIYRELTTALRENGYDDGKAQEFKVVYEAEKENRRLNAIQKIFE